MTVLGLKREDIINMTLHDVGYGSWIGFIWFEIGTDSGNAKAVMNLGFHKMHGNQFII
jgi:hypothetical protein